MGGLSSLVSTASLIGMVSANTGLADSYAIEGNSPAVVADFVNEYYRVGGSATTFASMFTFSRTGTATYFDSNGILQTAANGVARVGNHVYNGTSWVNKGILIETEARTNIVPYSSAISTTNYATNNNVVVTENDIAAPDGSISADKIAANVTMSSSVFLQVSGISVAGSAARTWSVYAKAGNISWLRLYGVDASDTIRRVWFNLSTGEVGTVETNVTGSGIIDVGGGWYRCWFTMVSAASTTTIGFGLSDADNTTTYSAASGDYIHLWGAQLEAGSTPSSYIPTAGTAVTRNADVLTIPAANMSYSATAMSFQMDGTMTYADEDIDTQIGFFEWRNGGPFIRHALDTNGSYVGGYKLFRFDGTTSTIFTDGVPGSYSPGVNVAFNIASRFTATDTNAAADGTARTADTTATAMPAISAVDLSFGIATAGAGGDVFTGNISQFRQWAVDLGNAGIETASS